MELNRPTPKPRKHFIKTQPPESPAPAPTSTKWLQVVGNIPNKLTESDFLIIKEIIPNPTLNGEERYIEKIWEYYLQNIKMGGSGLLNTTKILQLIKMDKIENSGTKLSTGSTLEEESDPESDKEEPPQSKLTNIPKFPPISKIDVLTCVLSMLDGNVKEDVFRLLAEHSIPLPLLSPNPWDSNLMFMAPLMSACAIKWETQNGIFDASLFLSPFKLLVATRVGNCKNGRFGKNRMLNAVLKPASSFHSYDEPAAAQRMPPIALPGLVELIWLTKETCGKILWEKIGSLVGKSECLYLLANLHGDSMDNLDVLEFLKGAGASFLVFRMKSSSKEKVGLNQVLSGAEIFSIFVDPPTNNNDGQDVLYTTNGMHGQDSLDKLSGKISHAFEAIKEADKFENPSSSGRIKLAAPTATGYSMEFLEMVHSWECKDIKTALESVFDLKKPSLKGQISVGDLLKKSSLLDKIVSIFQKLFLTDEQIAFNSILHINRYIGGKSLQITESILLHKLELEEQYSHFASKIPSGEWASNLELISLKSQIAEAGKDFTKNTLGLEHIFRSFGALYEHLILKSRVIKGDGRSSFISKLPQYIAKLLIKGQSFELFDGDNSTFNPVWFNAVSHELCKLYPGLKIFVLSILGVQSSGKSTLLNKLFGTKFSVSVGRCTRGLFLQLLFLEPSLKVKLGYDAILLIDTEGLRAPQKMNEPDYDKKDNEMATFAMSISNLTIINVKDEAWSQLTEILQIVVVTMARLEELEISPDILIVQHVSTVNKVRLSNELVYFKEAIKRAIEITEEQLTTLGVLNSNILIQLQRRLEGPGIVKLFHPYKSEASVNAAPSYEYHEDVVDLYQKILTSMNESKGKLLFHDWHALINSYWTAIKSADFSLRFRNLREIHEFIDRGKRISAAKTSIEAALAHHRKLLKKIIKVKIAEQKQIWNDNSNKEINKLLVLNDTVEECPNIVQLYTDGKSDLKICQKCTIAVARIKELKDQVVGKLEEKDVVATINSHVKFVREATKKNLEFFIRNQIEENGWIDFDHFFQELLLEHREADNKFLLQLLQAEPGKRDKFVNKLLDNLTQKLKTSEHVASNVFELRATMREETKSEYKDTIVMSEESLELLDSKSELGENFLRNPAAFQTRATKARLGRIVSNKSWNQGLNVQQGNSLISEIKKLPNRIMAEKRKTVFNVGMIAALKQGTIEILKNFARCHGKLLPIFEWKVHLYTLKHMFDVMERKFIENCMTTAIMQRARHQRKKLAASIADSANPEEQVKKISNIFLTAAKALAIKAGNEARRNELLECRWISSCENVRLAHLEHLYSQIQQDKFEESLRYFANPKLEMTAWFYKSVDSFGLEIADAVAQEIFKEEFVFVIHFIEQMCSGAEEFQKFFNRHLCRTDIKIQLGTLKFDIFAKMLVKEMENSVQGVFNSIKYRTLHCHQTKP